MVAQKALREKGREGRGDETKRKRGRKGKKVREGGGGALVIIRKTGEEEEGEMILFLLFRKVFLLFPWKEEERLQPFGGGLFIHQGEAGPMPTR